MDTIESRLARQEYEQRVRLLMPVSDHAARLTAEKQTWLLLSTVSNTLNSVRTWVKSYQAACIDVRLKGHLN